MTDQTRRKDHTCKTCGCALEYASQRLMKRTHEPKISRTVSSCVMCWSFAQLHALGDVLLLGIRA